MLSKNAKAVLHMGQKSEKKQLAYLDLKKELNWEFEDVRSACKQLIDADMAYERDYSPMPGHRLPWGIVLTERGRNSRKYFWAGIGEFLLQSIAVPIIVAIITAVVTTLITLWLQGLFPIK